MVDFSAISGAEDEGWEGGALSRRARVTSPPGPGGDRIRARQLHVALAGREESCRLDETGKGNAPAVHVQGAVLLTVLPNTRNGLCENSQGRVPQAPLLQGGRATPWVPVHDIVKRSGEEKRCE